MFEIQRGIIPEMVTEPVLRMINMELLKGFTTEEARTWRDGHHWFSRTDQKSLESDPLILGLADHLPDEWREGEMNPYAQIVLQFPTENPRAFEESFHEDTMPDWPKDKRWRRIVGIPLTSWHINNGTVRFQTDDEVFVPWVFPGDAVMFTGDQLHGPGPNKTGSIRYGVYFRWL